MIEHHLPLLQAAADNAQQIVTASLKRSHYQLKAVIDREITERWHFASRSTILEMRSE